MSLDVWAIYEPPGQDSFIVVVWRASRGTTSFVGTPRVVDTLDQARSLVPVGLIRMSRSPYDAPDLIETWI